MTNHHTLHSSPARTGRSSTHGKAILLGEHAVLYGAPAIALPVTDLVVRAEATAAHDEHHLESTVHTGPLDTAPAAVMPTVTAVLATLRHLGAVDERVHVRVDSAVPTARGLGSSAAVAGAVSAAVADALGRVLGEEERFAIVQECERIAHGTASGLDARAVVAGEPVWIEGGATSTVRVGAPFVFVVADTGVPGHTREAVTRVRERHDRQPSSVTDVVGRIAELLTGARTMLAAGDAAGLGAAMDTAHGLLRELDVSSPELDHLVTAARGAGALGAKLTGGGRGGCMLALATDADHADRIARSLLGAGAADTWTTLIGAPA
jgi:mevalonate kinase